MSQSRMQESTPLYSLAEAAERLDVSEATVREWLTSFNWERHYDGEGVLYLSSRDVDFLQVVKSLKDVDRSCESIVRVISEKGELVEAPAADEPPLEAEAVVPEAEPAVPRPDNSEQLATLKAELLELHAQPVKKKPFWKFWQ